MENNIGNQNFKTFDLTNTKNDFIYNVLDFYFEEITKQPSENIVESISNLVDTSLSYYLLARKNNVIDLSNSRKLLSVKLGKEYDTHSSILKKHVQINNKFDNLEKHLHLLSEKKDMNTEELKEYNISQMDEILRNHQKYINKISKSPLEIVKINLNNSTNDTNDINDATNKLLQIARNTSNNLNLNQKEEIENKTKELILHEINNKLLDNISKITKTSNKKQVANNFTESFTESKPDDIDKLSILEKKLKSDINLINNTIQNKIRLSTTNSNAQPQPSLNEKLLENAAESAADAVIELDEISETSATKKTENLKQALLNLNSRINTPVVNIVAAGIMLKFACYLLGI